MQHVKLSSQDGPLASPLPTEIPSTEERRESTFAYVRLAISDAAIPLKELSFGCKLVLAYLQARGGLQGVWGNNDQDDATRRRIAADLGVSNDTIANRLETLTRLERVSVERRRLNRAGFMQYLFRVSPFPDGSEFLPLDVQMLRIPGSVVSDGAKLARAFLEYRSRFRSDYKDCWSGLPDVAKGIGCGRSNVAKLLAEVTEKLAVSSVRRRRRSNIWKVKALSICETCRCPAEAFESSPSTKAETSTFLVHDRETCAAVQQQDSFGLQEREILDFKNGRILHLEESIIQESSKNRTPDNDLLVVSRQNCDSQPAGFPVRPKSPLAVLLLEHHLGQTPNEAQLRDLRSEIPEMSDDELTKLLVSRIESSPEPPRSFRWFRAVLRNANRQSASIHTPVYAPVLRMNDSEVNDLANAFDPSSLLLEP